MSVETSTTLDAAIAWHLRTRSLTGEEWEEFVSWLEADPANRSCFDDVAAADAALGQAPVIDLPARGIDQTDEQGPNKTVGWLAAGIAAAALSLSAWALFKPESQFDLERTSAGELKQIALQTGTRIDLNGDTRLVVDTANPTRLVLESGEALFRVRHSDQPTTVEVGGFKIIDLGTTFNVRMSSREIEVAVSEGEILFDPEATKVPVSAGERLLIDRDRKLVVKLASTDVGGWVAGNLSFENATVAGATEAIRRRSGIRIVVDPTLSELPFTGTLHLSGDGEKDVAHFAGLIGSDYRREGNEYFIGKSGPDR